MEDVAGDHRARSGGDVDDAGAAVGEYEITCAASPDASPWRATVFGLDDRIADLAAGHGLLAALAVALLLGLRHATDPDHLTAVSTLLLSERNDGARRALRLGLSWGAGHACTLYALGLPVVLLGAVLPESAQHAAELVIGLVIVALAIRVLRRWRKGERGQGHGLGRSPRAAFGIGLVHGVGGSAGVSILVIGAISTTAEAALALVLFAAATAVSMAMASVWFGVALTTGPAQRRLETIAPGFGTLALLFGAWYSLAAVGALPYMA
jgi:hypothetical protein